MINYNKWLAMGLGLGMLTACGTNPNVYTVDLHAFQVQDSTDSTNKTNYWKDALTEADRYGGINHSYVVAGVDNQHIVVSAVIPPTLSGGLVLDESQVELQSIELNEPREIISSDEPNLLTQEVSVETVNNIKTINHATVYNSPAEPVIGGLNQRPTYAYRLKATYTNSSTNSSVVHYSNTAAVEILRPFCQIAGVSDFDKLGLSFSQASTIFRKPASRFVLLSLPTFCSILGDLSKSTIAKGRFPAPAFPTQPPESGLLIAKANARRARVRIANMSHCFKRAIPLACCLAWRKKYIAPQSSVLKRLW